eukprot:6179089-Pleurochrysis_carterae.AAC.4
MSETPRSRLERVANRWERDALVQTNKEKIAHARGRDENSNPCEQATEQGMPSCARKRSE